MQGICHWGCGAKGVALGGGPGPFDAELPQNQVNLVWFCLGRALWARPIGPVPLDLALWAGLEMYPLHLRGGTRQAGPNSRALGALGSSLRKASIA